MVAETGTAARAGQLSRPFCAALRANRAVIQPMGRLSTRKRARRAHRSQQDAEGPRGALSPTLAPRSTATEAAEGQTATPATTKQNGTTNETAARQRERAHGTAPAE